MTETEVERLIVRLVGDASSYISMLNQAPAQAKASTTAIQGILGTFAGNVGKGLMGGLGGAVAFAGNAANALQGVITLGQGVMGALSSGFGTVMDAEKATASFKVMLGDGAKATEMMKDIRAFAAATPLQTNDLVQAGKTLMQFGVAGENVIPIMKMLGDTTGGDSQRFSQMSLAFGQMAATGRLMGQDLNQMINAGFNPLKEISRTTGRSMEDLKKTMEQGGISAGMVVQAFQSATSQGGAFAGMMNEQSKTLNGLWSTFGDNLTIITQQIFEKIVTALNLKGILAYAIEFLDMFSANFEANFTALTSWLTELWNAWIQPFVGTITSMGSAVAAWVSWAIGAFGNFVSGTVGFFQNFNTNISALWSWLGANWKILLTDMLNMIGVFGTNMVSNVGVYINMQMRLWTAFGGWIVGMFKNIFSFEVVDAVLTGLIIVGEKIREWAKSAWETLKAVFTGKTAPDALDSFIDQVKSDFDKGAENINFVQTAADIIKEESANFKNPLAGFESGLTDMPNLKLTADGKLLPDFVWNKAEEAKNSFAGGLKGFGDPIMKEANKMKAIDAVAADSAEALSRIAEFQAGKVMVTAQAMAQTTTETAKPKSRLGYSMPGDFDAFQRKQADQPEQAAATLDRMANYLEKLVGIGEKQLDKEPDVILEAGGALA